MRRQFTPLVALAGFLASALAFLQPSPPAICSNVSPCACGEVMPPCGWSVYHPTLPGWMVLFDFSCVYLCLTFYYNSQNQKQKKKKKKKEKIFLIIFIHFHCASGARLFYKRTRARSLINTQLPAPPLLWRKWLFQLLDPVFHLFDLVSLLLDQVSH